MTDYATLSATQAQQLLGELTDVLQGCVADGASVGFIDAEDDEVMVRFWQQRIASITSGDSELLVARQHGRIVATVILSRSGMPNGRHRAEISKLLVHPQARRQGIARELMQRAEQRARAQGKTLLVLDTRSGDVASDLYRSLGWQVAGSIPCYAESTAGVLDATTYMYKVLA
ncbi:MULTISPECIES: GNAT family N-acetyltransferase [unclassified Pantoea]|uniref:GNAT family N-acetyltransferase n=1 Tax=unclassified Pantoea TaxID=2630326 RepID=UPI0024775A2B|nr:MULTISPECIES: GNAT family N-acetyltransferase [unclassified Pantoea]GME34215.1 GNAT family N-acetyltransferase [Pantoea sp. QMID3]GME34550.1 GNAT family N-acetyltransferase [Pantoea sp. QMID1]GME55608.1 GNAT family N-acetyltransferase [Pantoea sp. QMID4]GME56641.1 GNAT family N-acetyltransferase [Pantoea sp. QMID2]